MNKTIGKMTNVYSALPSSFYFLPGATDCLFRTFAGSPLAVPLWNMYWMSNPQVDTLPGSTPSNYVKSFQPWPELTRALVRDVKDDADLLRALKKTPVEFHTWFAREKDYTIYDTWGVAGDRWVQNVLTRSREAADRGLVERPVVWCEFGTLRVDWQKAFG